MRLPEMAFDRPVTVRARTGPGELGPPVAARCRMELARAIRVDGDGAAAEVVKGRAFFPPEVAVPTGSELELDGATYRTIGENRPMSVLGPLYVEVLFA